MKSFKEFVIEEQDPGTYAAFTLDPESAQKLNQFYSNLLPSVQDPKKMHITTVYSPKSIDYKPHEGLPFQLNVIGHDMFGTKENGHVVVLKVAHPTLDERWNYARSLGAQWSYPDYNPHVSITNYDSGVNPENCDVSQLPVPDFPIYTGSEYTAPISEVS